MIDLRVLQVLCAHFCHELVSPIGAINNGIELLEDDDADFRNDATALIGQSARTAARRLQFYRFAYGTTPGAANINPRDLLLGLLEGGKVACEWAEPVSALTLDWQRLACNLALIAVNALPRGGRIAVRAGEAASGVAVEAIGDTVQLHPEVTAVFKGTISAGELTPRGVHGYVTAKLAEPLGARLSFSDALAGALIFLATIPG
jgi:histidine phosphotransferase ChpT